MQTFLPDKSFKRSAQLLDQQRLGKQRVETLQIVQALLGFKLENSYENYWTGEYEWRPVTDILGNPILNRNGSIQMARRKVIRTRKTPMSMWHVAYYEPKGWARHPAALMWKWNIGALLRYQQAITTEWVSRGYVDTCYAKTKMVIEVGMPKIDFKMPHWLGDEQFHLSHRSNLVAKRPDFYSVLFPEVEPGLEYVWPQ